MFFFIGGVQPKTVVLTRQARVCPTCAHFEICQKRIDHYLSLFFIPLFPVKKGSPYWICENCGTLFNDEGNPLSPHTQENGRTCSHCARPLYSDYSFCPYCGRAL